MDALLQALQADLDEATINFRVRIPWDVEDSSGEGQQRSAPAASEEGSLTQPRGASPLRLHPDASTNFDAKAEELLSALVSLPDDEAPPPPDPVPRDSQPVATYLPEHAIPESFRSFRDGEGHLIARCFTEGGMITGLQDEGYRALRRLAEAMQRTGPLRDAVSTDTVDELIFEWIRERVVGSTAEPMSPYVLDRVAMQVADYEAVFPLFRVQLPAPVQIGRVTLRTISGADFQRWNSALRHHGADAEGLNHSPLGDARGELQGFAGAVLTLRGVPDHVIEVGREAAEEAVAMLRLFSPAILSPVARSFCALSGKAKLEATNYLLVRTDMAGVRWGATVNAETDFVWRIGSERLRLIRREALDALVQALFDKKATTAFAQEVRSALVLYSQSALKTTPTDKLLSILIPLESLLLKSSTEPIGDNIAVRLALAIGQSLDERKRIINITKDAYALRSAFVHHGKPIERIDDRATLREFMSYAWKFFVALGAEARVYRQREEYLGLLDELKLAYPGDAATLREQR